MASKLYVDQAPAAFANWAEKYNSLVYLIRTMQGNGCDIKVSDSQIIISVSASTTGGGSVTVPDPLTIGTINVTNLNATNESVSYLIATSITSGSLSSTNVNAASVTATQFYGNLLGSSVTATRFYGDLLANSVTASQFSGNLNATSITATHIDGNLTATSITASYRINTSQLIATTITTDELYLDYLASITVDADDGLFYYVEATTANFDHLDVETVTATSITATSITSADFFGGAFRSTKNGVVTMDGRSVTFYVDAYTYGEVSATQYLSASSNSLAYYGQAGITISNNFTGKSMTVLASALSKDITLREIDVCDSGVPKKMLIIASSPY
jgi:hypothetical protein